jgi:alanyl-tRNA synthetase
MEGKLTSGAACTAKVDPSRRQAIRRAHSATHILHYALQKNLGKHAQQQGSKVEADHLRFDFTNQEPVKHELVQAIERDVATRVSAKEPVSWKLVGLAEARAAGAMMLFGEKYPDPVRMVSMGEFSRELCGGTHLTNTGEVEAFEIVAEEGVSSGTRRITALTGERAREFVAKTKEAVETAAKSLEVGIADVVEGAKRLVQYARDLKKQIGGGPKASLEKLTSKTGGALGHVELKAILRDAARLLNVSPFDVPSRLVSQQAEIESLKKELAGLEKLGDISADSLLADATTLGTTKLIAVATPGANTNLMRQWIDQIRKKTPSSAVLLVASQGEDKVTLIAGLSKDLVDRGLSAGNWVKEVATIVGGSGGGKPDLAQAGGKDPSKVNDAIFKGLTVAKGWLAS